MKRLTFFIPAVLLLLMHTGCDHSIDSMIDNYNSKIPEVDNSVLAKDQPSPGEPGFYAEDMLEPVYFKEAGGSTITTIELTGPANCKCTWDVVLPNAIYNETVNIEYPPGYSQNSRSFVAYIPGSGLEPGKSYIVTLTVEDKGGKKYRDSCGLVIYRPYNY